MCIMADIYNLHNNMNGAIFFKSPFVCILSEGLLSTFSPSHGWQVHARDPILLLIHFFFDFLKLYYVVL